MKSTANFEKQTYLVRRGDLVLYRDDICIISDMYSNNKMHELVVVWTNEDSIVDVGTKYLDVEAFEMQPFRGSVTLVQENYR